MSIVEKIRGNRDRYQRKLADIQQDNDLTAAAKARKLRPVFEEAKREEARKDWTEWADAHAEMSGSGLGETLDSGIPSLEEPSELRGFQEAAQA